MSARAALAPEVFDDLSGFHESSVEVIASHLVQNGFTPERAKRVADVFLTNKSYMKNEDNGAQSESESDKQLEIFSPSQTSTVSTSNPPPSIPRVDPLPSTNVLARYSIPLGENEATIVFTGKSLSPEDLDALIEYVELFKKQFERRQPKDIRQSATEAPEATSTA